jgi:hypothetical protein
MAYGRRMHMLHEPSKPQLPWRLGVHVLPLTVAMTAAAALTFLPGTGLL